MNSGASCCETLHSPCPQLHIYHEREDLWCFRVDLERVVAELPWTFQMMVALIAEGYSEREMARRLGVKLSTLKAWHRFLMERLRARLEEA